jgi:hypothetical protein
MSNEEPKNALLNGFPVECNGIAYKCVSAIVYRNKGGKIDISAEVLDKNNNSVCYVDPKGLKEVL